MKQFFSSSIVALLGLSLSLSLLTTPLIAQLEEAADSQAAASEIRRGIQMGTNTGKSRSQRYMENRVTKIEPELIGDPARLQTYIHFFERELINDTRLFLFDVDAEYDEVSQTVKLSGYVEYPQTKTALDDMFLTLGFEKIQNDVAVLPHEDLGDKVLGVVTTPNTLTYSKTTTPRETMTDGVMGDLFFLLMEKDGYYLAHAPEGYVCYIDKNSIERFTAEEYKEQFETVRFMVQQPIELEESIISPGSTLRLDAVEGEWLTVSTPNGVSLNVMNDKGIVIHPTASKQGLAAIETAKEFLGTDYVWAGKSTSGIDCSGLVQSSYRAHGINLPRDAYMQAYSGRLSATRYSRELMKPADLLYFIGSVGKISHTAIYIGNDQFIEASSGNVHYTSFNPAHDNYSKSKADRFCFAKRVIN